MITPMHCGMEQLKARIDAIGITSDGAIESMVCRTKTSDFVAEPGTTYIDASAGPVHVTLPQDIDGRYYIKLLTSGKAIVHGKWNMGPGEEITVQPSRISYRDQHNYKVRGSKAKQRIRRREREAKSRGADVDLVWYRL